MTIGIAATGPWAGAGILAGLRAVEAVGRGAIGGFVSLAALTADQQLLCAETQTGGTGNLFTGSPPEALLSAPYAALISSGPDRPTPLSQFVAAAPGVGIVTGHRFPHVKTEDDQALNILILEAMQQGCTAQDAVDTVIAAHPSFDAGFIALSTEGELGLGNMPSVLDLRSQGLAVQTCPETGMRVATVHNAIHPINAIATLANEVVLDAVQQRLTEVRSITMAAGIALSFGETTEIHIDGAFKATKVLHPRIPKLPAETSIGIGDHVKVVQTGHQIGWLGLEPFMVVRNNAIVSLDGKHEIQLPVLMRRT